ncbi:hypothetical protein OW763_04980 [Clostridium aestuarii]|uniref:Uncharacterized protein n=1 Tax=Clostridium aestuarii TaxID=338193 RepID=A0ABT4CXI2_9CLOT|nr:hypothetical protein [Clostridium aestuarii]MCY6483701.1 hypothetical protein [Clostridium aestuarii]
MSTAIILLIAGIILIVLNIKAINKEKNSFKEAFTSASDNMQEFQVEIGKVRREFAETLLELQTQIVDIENKIKLNENMNFQKIEKIERLEQEIKFEEKKDVCQEEKIENIEEIHNNTSDNSVKINEIDKLIKKGLSVEQIADKLKIGKGEVLLIKELYLK